MVRFIEIYEGWTKKKHLMPINNIVHIYQETKYLNDGKTYSVYNVLCNVGSQFIIDEKEYCRIKNILLENQEVEESI